MDISSLASGCESPQKLDLLPLGVCRPDEDTKRYTAESVCSPSATSNIFGLEMRRTDPDQRALPGQVDDAQREAKCQIEGRVIPPASGHVPVGSKMIQEDCGTCMVQVTCAGWQCFRAVFLQGEEEEEGEDHNSEMECFGDEMPGIPTSTSNHFIVSNPSMLHGRKRRRTSSDYDSPISKKPKLVHSQLPPIRRLKLDTIYQHESDDREQDFDEKNPANKHEQGDFKFEKWDGPRSYPLKDGTTKHFEKARYYSSYTLSHGKRPQEAIIPYTHEENECLVELIRLNLKHKDLCDQFNQRFANKQFQGSTRPERSADAIGKNITRRGLRTQAALPVQSKYFLPGYQKQSHQSGSRT